MSDSNTGFFHVGDVLPIESVDNPYVMTARQYAAVKLRVPDSGTDWLDEMITKSLRDEFAARAMQSILQGHYYKVRTCAIGYGEVYLAIAEEFSEHAYEMADAMLKARK